MSNSTARGDLPISGSPAAGLPEGAVHVIVDSPLPAAFAPFAVERTVVLGSVVDQPLNVVREPGKS